MRAHFLITPKGRLYNSDLALVSPVWGLITPDLPTVGEKLKELGFSSSDEDAELDAQTIADATKNLVILVLLQEDQSAEGKESAVFFPERNPYWEGDMPNWFFRIPESASAPEEHRDTMYVVWRDTGDDFSVDQALVSLVFGTLDGAKPLEQVLEEAGIDIFADSIEDDCEEICQQLATALQQPVEYIELQRSRVALDKPRRFNPEPRWTGDWPSDWN